MAWTEKQKKAASIRAKARWAKKRKIDAHLAGWKEDTGARWDPPPCPYEVVEIVPPPDPVNHPTHYTRHPSGIECIQVTEHMNFCLGNALKYIWRAGEKGSKVEDLKKSVWYIQREIERIESADAETRLQKGA